jgi:hypothetical protein
MRRDVKGHILGVSRHEGSRDPRKFEYASPGRVMKANADVCRKVRPRVRGKDAEVKAVRRGFATPRLDDQPRPRPFEPGLPFFGKALGSASRRR